MRGLMLPEIGQSEYHRRAPAAPAPNLRVLVSGNHGWLVKRDVNLASSLFSPIQTADGAKEYVLAAVSISQVICQICLMKPRKESL